MEFWFLAIIGVLLTGISKSGFAGGAGVVAVPLLALVMPVAEAAALMLPLLLVMDARSISYYWQHVNWRLLRRLLPGSLIGIVAGGLMMGLLSDSALAVSLGLLSILFAVWHEVAAIVSKWRGSVWFWSVLSGMTSTLLHAGGPPINIYMLSVRTQKLEWLATVAVFFGVMNAVKVLPYTLNEQWSVDLWGQCLLLFPVALFGVYLGRVLQARLSEQYFVLACRALLFVSGVLLLVKSF